MNIYLDRREDETRRLLASAAAGIETDPERLWRDFERRARREHRQAPGPWVAAAAVAAVVAGVVGGSWLGSHPTGQTAPGAPGTQPPQTSSPASAATTSIPKPSTAATPSSSAGATALPTLTPGMVLPRNQQYADFVPISSDMRLKGRTIGLGTFRVGGKAVHLLLAPGYSLPGSTAFADGRRHQGMCLIVLPASAPLNVRDSADGREYDCHFLPDAGARGAAAMGGAGLGDPMTTRMDEFRDVLWPVVTTSSATTTVEYVQGGVTTRLQYRITHPDLQGAVFIGFLEYVPRTSPTRFSIVGRDSAGRELFHR